MGRKVAILVATLMIAVISVVLVGGQSDGGLLWWRAHEPIYIFGNDAFTFANGVVSGSGSAADPYVIEGWYIDGSAADYGIYIDHTTAHFVIRSCVVEQTRNAGIYFNSVTNGSVEGCQLSRNDTAMRFMNASGNSVAGSVIAQNRYGIVMVVGSRDNTIYGNSFIDNGLNGADNEHRNTWTGATGNYWSNYTGSDANGDGVGDRAYAPLDDPRPLVAPPVTWMHVTPLDSGMAGTGIAGAPVSPSGEIVVSSQTPIVLTSNDPGSGVAGILYSINGGDWQQYTGPFMLSGPDGPYRVSYYGVDNLGNAEPATKIDFLLDDHAPQTQISFGTPNYHDATGQWITSKTPIVLDLVAASTYGVTKTFYAIDGGQWRRYNGPFHIGGPDGPHQISYYSRNASGKAEPPHATMVFKDDVPPVTRGTQGTDSMTPARPENTPSPSSQVNPQTESATETPLPAASPVETSSDDSAPAATQTSSTPQTPPSTE